MTIYISSICHKYSVFLQTQDVLPRG